MLRRRVEKARVLRGCDERDEWRDLRERCEEQHGHGHGGGLWHGDESDAVAEAPADKGTDSKPGT